jgi:hypothetical protein
MLSVELNRFAVGSGNTNVGGDRMVGAGIGDMTNPG